MKRILKTAELYDNYNDYMFGYLGIDIDSGKVELYSDDKRRNIKNGEIYKINPNDEDFYWEFYHNGEYIRLNFDDLSENTKKVIEKLKKKQIQFTVDNNYSINNFQKLYDNLAFYKGIYNSYMQTSSSIYNNLDNCICIPEVKDFIKQAETDYVPTKKDIEEYNNLIEKIRSYSMFPMFDNGMYFDRQKKEHEEDLKAVESESMQKVKRYLDKKEKIKKNKVANENALLFGLGQLRVSSVNVDTEKKVVNTRIGFYEKKLLIDDIKKTVDGDEFIFAHESYLSKPCGLSLELIFNDLECHYIDPNYKSVINRSYGPLLDFITDKKLRNARYEGGIKDYYKIMNEIIPDNDMAKELLTDMDYREYSESEVYDMLSKYVEAKIDSLNLTKEDLYNYCKKCKDLGVKKIKQYNKNFDDYIKTSPVLKIANELFYKLISRDKISGTVKIIMEYAQKYPNNLELHLLKIFAEKYSNIKCLTMIGSKVSIGAMTQSILLNRIEEQTYEFLPDGSMYVDANGKTKNEMQRIEDKFSVFLPEELKDAFKSNDSERMISELIKIFGPYEKKKGISYFIKKLRLNRS